MQTQCARSFGHRRRNVLPAGAPGCSQGAPYSFWVRQGDLARLAVILSGGCHVGRHNMIAGEASSGMRRMQEQVAFAAPSALRRSCYLAVTGQCRVSRGADCDA